MANDFSRVSLSIALLLIAASFVCSSQADQLLQTGRRFPLGVQIGGENVSCESLADLGLLRFHENRVEVCQNVSGGAVQWILVGSNETIAVNDELLDLRERVEILESGGGGVSTPHLIEANLLQSITMCNLHGVYSTSLRRCVCDCTATLGCWNTTDFCSTCASGWIGEYCLGDTEAPEISITGGDVVTHEAGSAYIDAGATSHDNKDLDISSGIQSSSTVLSNTVGVYTVTYTSTDNAGNSDSATRTVHVVDTTPPSVSLSLPLSLTMEAGDAYIEGGYSTSDNADDTHGPVIVTSNSSSLPLRLPGVYTVAYIPTDAQGNSGEREIRSVEIVDTTVPEISLVGESVVYHARGIPYVDLGAIATDNSDLSISLSSLSTVDSDTVGNYSVVYSAVDGSGNSAVDVEREVRVRDIGTGCDSWAMLGATENGVYDVEHDGHTRKTFCRFSDSKGYDLLFNLNSGDSTVRAYGDSVFWEGDNTVGTLFGNETFPSEEIKTDAFNDLEDLEEIVLVYHDGQGNEVAEARYRILCPYRTGLSFQEIMSTLGNDFVLTGNKLSPNFGMNLIRNSGDTYETFDPFMESGEPLVINRQTAYTANVQRDRIGTTRRITNPVRTHTFGGIGGYHQQSSWAMDYEFTAVEGYCPTENAYTKDASTIGGNYRSVSGFSGGFPFADCSSVSVRYRDIHLAVYAVGGTRPLKTTARQDSCQAYLSRSLALSLSPPSGPTLLSTGETVYCLFDEVNQIGLDLLINLETSDTVSRMYGDTDFWLGGESRGDATNALTAEYVSPQYMDGCGMSTLTLLYHTNGVSLMNATYNTLPGVTLGRSLGDLMNSAVDVTFTGGKINPNGDIPLVQDDGYETYDPFIERSDALVVNRQSAYTAGVQTERIGSADRTTNPVRVHTFGGIGGHHEQQSWGFDYEFTPVEGYCPTANLYTSSSSTRSGNYATVSGKSRPDIDCSGSQTYFDYDLAIFARIDV